MSAYGMMLVTQTGRSGGMTAGAAGSSQKHAGEAAGFAGMLVQVIGQTPNVDDSTAGKGMLIGMPIAPDASSVVDVPEVLTANVSEAELKPLLQGLLEQLAKLDENGELPADFEQQLAALLNLLHQLVKTPEYALSGGAYAADDNGLASPDNKAADLLLNATNGRPIAQVVAETLLQWSDKLSQSDKLTVSSLSALAETLRQMQQLVQQSSSTAQANANTASRTAAFPSSGTTEGQAQQAGNQAAAAESTAQAGTKAETIVQRTTAPFRQPVWIQQAVSTPAAEGQLTGASAIVATADTAEPANPSGAVPVWTMQKGEAGTPLSSGTHAQTPSATPVPVQQFAEQMGKFLVKQFVLSQGNGTTEARISLHPEHLGQVNIKIMIQNGMLTAKFLAENGVARELLESQMAQLRTALQGHGLQVDKVEVVQQSHASTASFFQHQQREQGSDHARSQSGQRGSQALYGDDLDFEQELERTAYLREVGYGNSLNVTA